MGKHYVCLGLCRGVSDTPGYCNHLGCPKEGELLAECYCEDRRHLDRAPKEEPRAPEHTSDT